MALDNPPETAAQREPGAQSEVLLDVVEVSRTFGGVRAVDRANLQVAQGEVTSLIGPNGAGKTTLFNAVTGCIPATTGRMNFQTPKGTREIQKMRPDQITRLGIARTFQNIRLFSNLSALDNVKIGFHPRSHAGVWGAMIGPPHVRREERNIERAGLLYLDYCGLTGAENEISASLPYGLQRRLEIARALATGPRLLLLDEPAAGMNPAESRDLLDLIRKIVRSGVTVFLIEHDMRVVMNVSDRIYVLDHGVVIASGKPAEIQNNAAVIEAYLGHGANEPAAATA